MIFALLRAKKKNRISNIFRIHLDIQFFSILPLSKILPNFPPTVITLLLLYKRMTQGGTRDERMERGLTRLTLSFAAAVSNWPIPPRSRRDETRKSVWLVVTRDNRRLCHPVPSPYSSQGSTASQNTGRRAERNGSPAELAGHGCCSRVPCYLRHPR